MKTNKNKAVNFRIGSAVADPTEQVFEEYMSKIIKKLPNPGSLKMLKGTSNGQASFVFKSPSTLDINSTLYNNQISPRVVGKGQKYGVDQVEFAQSTFTNDCLDVYNKLEYQLSQADTARQQENDAKTAAAVRKLIPVWNDWVKAIQPTDVKPLDSVNTNIALIQMTATLTSVWLNPEYAPILAEDPEYPYVNLTEFNTIFNKIPLSVPKLMRGLMIDIYGVQGTTGSVTAQLATASTTLQGIRTNITSPTAATGGLPLAGTEKLIPGMKFEPDEALALINQLKGQTGTVKASYSATVTKTEETVLTVDASVSGGIRIPILSFLSWGTSASARTSIFQRDFAGSKFSVEVIVNNPTVNPVFSITPLLYNISTNQGWLTESPVMQALKNEGNPDVTGYVFTSPPNFDFSVGGDFGYINTMIFSQFLEFSLRFDDCNSKEVKRTFETELKTGISFLGIPLGGSSVKSSYSYAYSAETDTSITVTMKPNAPGYIPGTADIMQSLCGLIAVGTIYPFAEQ